MNRDIRYLNIKTMKKRSKVLMMMMMMIMMRKLKLMMTRIVFMGNLMMRTTWEWLLYRRMSCATCKAKQRLLQAGCYSIISPLWMFFAMKKTE